MTIAVEMARANLLMALPSVPHAGLRIWQGDSLQTDRPDTGNRTLFEDANSLTIYSRKDRIIKLPKAFLIRESVINDVQKLVKSADNCKSFPPGLDSGLSDDDKEMLHDAHDTLTEICQDEGNSIWAWYILNRTGPFILANEKVSRIVANPPWVRISNIQNEKRKGEVLEMSKAHGLWVGGKNATGFDIASLFVVKCRSLYLTKKDKSGWVLPQGAIKSGNWKKYQEKMKERIVKLWDLGTLPFPTQSKSCVNVIADIGKHTSKILQKKQGSIILPHDDWKTVKGKTKWLDGAREFQKLPSKYYNSSGVLARSGATIFPHCLVMIQEMTSVNSNADITTKPARHEPWKSLGSQTGIVPAHWVHELVNSKYLLPYTIKKTLGHAILPLNNEGTDFEDTSHNKYWRDAEGLYQKHKGGGSNTPKTLLKRINHQNVLLTQLKRKGKYIVIYNKSGADICASVIAPNIIMADGTYTLNTKSKNEALFLVALLNADSLQEAFRSTRKADRHFDTHFWREIPLPRYDKTNELHNELVELARKAEKLAKVSQKESRESIRKLLRDDGVSGDIDGVVRKLLPKYT